MLANLVEAVDLALARAMSEDERVIILGEDVGKNGGVFRATVGLRERFGAKRVLDTPLAETLIAGLAVGMSSQGLRPVAEIQFMGFIYAALEHLISHAARLRNRTRGRLSCPLTIRVPFGGGIHAPEHHSESTEAILTHCAGLSVVAPSSPRTAYGLLLAAIRSPDPVIFLEPERIYRSFKEELDDNGIALPLEQCLVWRKGHDLTLVCWGSWVQDCLRAADSLATQGIACEVIDVACLKPLDMETIIQSVALTGRCLIVQEAVKSGGLGSDIAARLAEHAFYALRAPIKILSPPDVIVPYFKLEAVYLPQVEDIVRTAQQLMEAKR
ncbi:alpha-ketoacid dehydrogenase subunit beta [Agitococcus lubricus]|uniref:2-oxoisovalerate dehydrogenase subunit beta n=1 Tax=Agitococcus lubricus TaxID=1077255 RepID=A0A2T5IV49_9GAMM|nr:alpha-ketoacid dehydrogenase subunit beta [Agitococcus lubricus]PTQ87709.1 pyruvate dehydrogenase E1 component beta subunit [Agitococcus lubricus]